jgi:hypothetical protein
MLMSGQSQFRKIYPFPPVFLFSTVLMVPYNSVSKSILPKPVTEHPNEIKHRVRKLTVKLSLQQAVEAHRLPHFLKNLLTDGGEVVSLTRQSNPVRGRGGS